MILPVRSLCSTSDWCGVAASLWLSLCWWRPSMRDGWILIYWPCERGFGRHLRPHPPISGPSYYSHLPGLDTAAGKMFDLLPYYWSGSSAVSVSFCAPPSVSPGRSPWCRVCQSCPVPSKSPHEKERWTGYPSAGQMTGTTRLEQAGERGGKKK